LEVNPAKLPDEEAWLDTLLPNKDRGDREKDTYYLGWFYDGLPIEHFNVNKISYAENAYIHLHSWNPQLRSAGFGAYFCGHAINMFIRKFALKRSDKHFRRLKIRPESERGLEPIAGTN
jgi:hypothetical protein